VHGLRLEVGAVRRLVWPMRDIVAGLPRLDGLLIGEATLPFYRDLADHIHQVVEQLDAGRERITSALELDLALASNRMNDVMRVLTIVSTLFIPLGFIVGLYGMNFAHMPELSWRWGYPAVWGLMLTLVVVMLVIFRRKRWL
jgi:magnesium transporter